MSKISQNIVDQIKEAKITPKPRWQFVLRNVLLMTAVITAMVVGGLVMSLVFLKVGDLDWEFVSLYGERGLPRFFEVLPLLWMLLLALVLLLAVWSFEKTESAYKIRPFWIVLGTIFTSMVLAGGLYVARGSELLESVLRSTVPAYDQMERERAERFHLPVLGVLPGRVLEISGDSGFTLQDLKASTWVVVVEPKSPAQRALRMLKTGQMIVVLGKEVADNEFQATDMRTKRGMMLNVRSELFPHRPKKLGVGRGVDLEGGQAILPLPMPGVGMVPNNL